MTSALQKRIHDDETFGDEVLAAGTSADALAADEVFAGPAPDLTPLAGPEAPAAESLSAPARSLLRFITCGSVDDGKSTLIGRLLYDAGAVFDDQLEALKRDSKKFGTTGEELDLALLVDGLAAEREQGITIDVAYRYFSAGGRAFIIADTPGHEQYTRNMATGASQAELAIILVDARKGILPQTRRHSFITSMVGIKSVVVAVNKMDLVGYDQATFETIRRDYEAILPFLGFTDVAYVPLSAKNGDNVTARSANTPWYRGETLLQHLVDASPETFDAGNGPFRMPVQWVNRPNLDFRGFCGTIAAGRIAKGDAVVALPGRRATRVKAVFGPDGEVDHAGAGEAVTLTLEDEVDVSRGDVLVTPDDAIAAQKTVEAEILWMVDRPLVAGGRLVAKLGSAQTPAHVRSLDGAVDIHSYAARPAAALLMNEIGRVTLAFDRPTVAATYEENRELGSFILVDQLTNETVALGLVRKTAAAAAETPAATASALERARTLWLGAGAGERPGRIPGMIRHRALSAGLIAILSMLLGLSILPALLLGLIDFALRPLLRSVLDRTDDRRPAADPATVGDGGGI